MTLSFTFSLLLLNTPGHGLLRKKRSGTKGELTGTNQRHIRTHGLGASHLCLS
jgi:hypothetical protein